MEMDVEQPRSNIIALHGSRIPEMLGTFHLDDHNVQEWSDYNGPGMKHRARKEIGKWIDRDRNADIKFQRHEDSKRSETSQEQQRTEVIQGNAPDATFQIVRSQRQFQDSDDKSGRVTTMSTSYQMSTTRGIRSTSKSTSNKTTTKTVTVSGGRSDDFENLKMSFQPLDTSTQRERINVSRSGTMGVRRPPTRRHTPAAAILSSSPDELQEEDEGEENHHHRHHVIVMNHESENTSATITENGHKNSDSSSTKTTPVPIQGLKNLSSKIRVGFPVEIQLELQSKLRYSNGEENGVIIHTEDDEDVDAVGRHDNVDIKEIVEEEQLFEDEKGTEMNSRVISSSKLSNNSTVMINQSSKSTSSSSASILGQKPTTTSLLRGGNPSWQESKTNESNKELSKPGVNESAESLFLFRPSSYNNNSNQDNNENFTFDYSEEQKRRKSYGFESFNPHNDTSTHTTTPSSSSSRRPAGDVPVPELSDDDRDDDVNNDVSSKIAPSLHERLAYNTRRLSPSPSLSRSWDLIQSVANQQGRDERKKLFLSSSHLDSISSRTGSNLKTGFTSPPQRSIVNLNPFGELDDSEFPPEPHDSLESPRNRSPERSLYTGSTSYLHSDTFERPLTKVGSTPDIIHHNIELEPTTLSDKSRRLMSLLNETPDLLNKMSSRKPKSDNALAHDKKAENDRHASRENKFNDDFSHINETLSRLLEKSNNNVVKESNNKIHHDSSSSPSFTFGPNITGKAKILRGDQLLAKTYENEGIAASSSTTAISEDESVKKQTQVSHTWISSADQHKPSQRARDNNVTTSISATNDPYRKGQKKVEFCKTEVHFTPDSGKFHIVETDENKPSTVHLFRRKKREKKSSSSSSSSSVDTKKLEIIGKEQKEKIEETKKEKLVHQQQQQQQQLHLNSFNKKPFTSESTTSSSLRNLYSSKDGDSTALELVLGENALVDVVGVDGNKNSLFHHRHWSKQPEDDEEEDEERAGEELGIDEQTVTPTTITPALTPNKFQQEETLSLSNSNQRSTTTRDQHQILNFKTFEDQGGENSSYLPKRQHKSKESTLVDDALISSKGIISRTHVLNNKTATTTTTNRLISEPLLQLDKADGSSGDSDNNVNGDYEDDDDEYDARSDDTTALHSNYGELKIQRYLKQLKYDNSGRDSPISLSSPIHILPTDVDQQELHVDDDDDDNHDGDANKDEDDDLGQFRYDSAYENGSFVPLATRRSLIEMNNRNRTKNKSNSHASDNSSTTSNYSLPLSDRDRNSHSNNNGDYHHPSSLKLKTMEAIIDTKSHKPQITSVDLRYGFSPNDPSSYFNEPVKRNFKVSKLGEDDDGSSDAEPYEVISEPVKPEIKSLPPFRSGRTSLTSFTDTQEETLFKQKPPVPILPSKFSSFEKTGAALRERFNAKTTVRPKPEGKEAAASFIDGKPPSIYTSPTYVPSKSVVKIGGEEDEVSAGNVKIRIDSDDRRRINHDLQISMDQEMSNDDSLLDNNSHHHGPEPILSMDHTWKGPAHFDNHHHHHHHHHHNHSTSKAASVARSLTFPKSSRPEPEWVAKAKSRETRIKDWNLIGKQQYGTARKSEPPWITEIKYKSKLGRSSPTPETKSLLIGSIVYPWEKERDYGIREGSTVEPSTTTEPQIQIPETPSVSAPTDTIGHPNVIITELPDDETEIMSDHYVTKNTTARDTIILPQPRTERGNQEQRSSAVIGQQKGLSDSLDRKLMAPLMESSKRYPRKPLQTSSTANKNGGPNSNTSNRLAPHDKPKAPPRPPKPPQRVSSLTNKSQAPIPPPLLSADEKRSNSRAPSPSDKRSAVPPPPQPHPRTIGIPTPSPPEKRTYVGSSNGPSSHHNESRISTPQKTRRNNNSNANSDLEDSIIITSRNNNTPIHNHPLVKVAKIPSARSTHAVPKNVASPEGRSSSGTKHNKAKHHVVTTETKIACKSKLMDGQATGVKETEEASSPRLVNPSHRPLPKVPPPRAPTAVSPLRNRQINITNNNNG